jgi:outer membrane beta-barrel protein
MKTKALLVLLLTAAPMTASAADADTALVEKAVVRNRLFTTSGRFELGLNLGFSLLSRLTDHYLFDATVAFNISEVFAIEILAGWAYSTHTSLADDVASKFAMNNAKTADDLSDLWEMTVNGTIGVRWQPIYGKIGIFSEYPLHFQFYVALGAGGALLKRTSVVICNHKTGSTCDEYFTESRGSFVATGSAGFRFFVPVVGFHHSIRLEVRDYLYPDQYYTGVDRAAALANPAGDPTGGGKLVQAGVTNLVQFHIGYAYLF